MSASSVPVSKVKRGIYVCVTVVMMVLFAYCVFGTASFAAGFDSADVNTEVFNTNEVLITQEGEIIKFSCNSSKLTGDQYVVMMVEGTAKPTTISAENILYIDQQAAASKTVLFEMYPKAQKDSVVLLSGNIGGENKQVVVATLDYPEPTGYSISGRVLTYNPNNQATVSLYQNGALKKSITLSKEKPNAGLLSQEFTITGVVPGTYDLVVEKTGHLKYTISNIEISNADIDLKEDTRYYIANIQLPAGNIFIDNYIDPSDFTTILQSENYGKLTSEAGNELCDINGDGYIDPTDFTTVLLPDNYGKTIVEYDYKG